MQRSRDCGAFHPPDVIIPAKGSALFKATLVSYVSGGLRNGVATLNGFCAKGQIARWNIEAATIRHLTPELIWHQGQKAPAGTRLRIHCSGAEIEGSADENGLICWEEKLTVDAGPGTLQLEVLEIPPLEHPLELFAISFSERA